MDKETKVCRKCSTPKSITDFYVKKKWGKVRQKPWVSSICKKCHYAQTYVLTKARREKEKHERGPLWAPKPQPFLEPSIHFWAKVRMNGPEHPTLGKCWIWNGRHNSKGYGSFAYRIEMNRQKQTHAHKFSYEQMVGPVPEGKELDHLCRVRGCVNPFHLEAVTHRENVMRGEGIAAKNAAKTHCKNGHPLSGDNLRIDRGKYRICRTCVRNNWHAWKERHETERVA